ncbi:SCO6745 family protein [Geodermatophilus sp. URMC 62]|uniref:SCO6745 family protein n=1 Tax=Geodermatophilus sp. URMC 62 TaxID=3423414 RepID=UPI00406CCB91
MTSPATARRLWALGEPFHALTYFADETRTAGEAVGLSGFWSVYFALRAAPLGPVGPEVVTATFYNFAPGFVARRVPEVWSSVTPAAALEARLAGVDAAVRRVLGEWAALAEAAEAAELAGVAARAVDQPGRPLAAANAGLDPPTEPHLALWQALTTLREHRGDGHTAALLGREVSGAAAHVLAAAAGRTDREWLQRARGWDDEAWAAAAEELSGRGWLDGEELSAEGLAMVTAIEADTDRLALGPWRALGDTGCDRLAELLAPLRRAVVTAGLFPDRNPIGVPDPT